jgi:membrane fusion protein, heavy metal efflux system
MTRVWKWMVWVGCLLLLFLAVDGRANEKKEPDHDHEAKEGHAHEKEPHGGATKDSDHNHEAEKEHAHREAGHDERIVLSPETLEITTFHVVPVKRQALQQETNVTAVVEPNENYVAHVSPRIAGRVVKVQALLGSNVTKGEVLAELDSLELGRAKAEYLKAKSNLQVARANYTREQRLFKQKISSEKEYLNAKGEFLAVDTEFKAAREALRLLGIRDQEIKNLSWGKKGNTLSRFPLLAPFSGTIVKKHITLGELIKPEDKPYTIADLSTVWVLADVYEKNLGRIRAGARARIELDAYPGQYVQGDVTYVSDLLDENTRTAQARIVIPNSKREFKPGMFASVTILSPLDDGGFVTVVPGTAIHRVRGEPMAFVRESEREFAPRELELGRNTGPYVEVLRGLKEGEEVVTEGGFYLKSALLKEEMRGARPLRGEHNAQSHL